MRREFIDDLWTEASSLKESEWKSSAREHLLEFEKQLHEAVDAGITHTSSGTSSWTLSNSVYYSASLIFTLGIKIFVFITITHGENFLTCIPN